MFREAQRRKVAEVKSRNAETGRSGGGGMCYNDVTMKMNIAIPYSEGDIFQHFGKATQFKIYTIEAGVVVSSEVKETGSLGHEELGLWLVQNGVVLVICGQIGPGAQGALLGAGIPSLAGVEGSADEAMAQFLDGTLSATREATCGGHHGGACGGGCAGHHGHGGCGGHAGGSCGCQGGGCCH